MDDYPNSANEKLSGEESWVIIFAVEIIFVLTIIFAISGLCHPTPAIVDNSSQQKPQIESVAGAASAANPAKPKNKNPEPVNTPP